MSSSQSPARQKTADALIGRVINDRFRVIELIARGGMGRVYRAEQVLLGRQVALKVLDRPASAESDTEFETRFLNEASTAAKLQHSNTVTVFDYGRTEDGICFIAMELVEGVSLRDAIRAGAPFSPQRTVHITLQIARSLREAHKLDVIHRDLKPANVLLASHDDDADFVKVLDFGLVKHVDNDGEKEGLTREGLFLGSPKYMAPEHILGDRVDARADVYSLGVCMYEMLSGHVPFGHDSTVKILMAHMHEPVPPLRASCPPALAELVMRCLAKSASDRVSSMDELIVELKRTVGSDTMRSGEYALPLDALSRARLDAHSPSGGSGFRRPSLPASSPSEVRAAGLTPSVHQPLQPAPTPVAVQATGPQPALRSKKPVVQRAAVILLLVLAGAGLGLAGVKSTSSDTVVGTAQREQPEAAPTSTVKMLAALPAPAALASTQEAPMGEQAHIFVRLDSNPSGAMVMFEGRAYGPTPANVEIAGPAVSRGSEVTFVFEKEGYEPVRITRLVKMQNLTIETDLSREQEGKQRSRPQASAPRTVASLDKPAPEPVAAPAVQPAVPAPAPVVQQPVAAAQPAPAPAAPAPVAAAVPSAAPKAAPPANVIAKPSTPLPGGPESVPEYPRAARRAGVTGVVVARVNVGADGKVASVVIMDGPSVFHESVRDALSARRYTPAKLANGQATSDSHVVRVPFTLQ